MARAGRIWTPHWFYELVRRRINHCWLVLKRGKLLVLLEKEEEERNDKPLFWIFSLSKLDIEKVLRTVGFWETVYRWEGRLDFMVIYEDGGIEK